MRLELAVALVAVSAMLHAEPPAHVRVIGADEFSDAISPELRARIDAETAHNLVELTRTGQLQRQAADANVANLAWPLRPLAGFDQFDYHGTQYFVDHDPRFPGFVQDYTCGLRSYDRANGYNHSGTDYYLWPFPWLMMDQGLVQVVAAAPGVIIAKADGSFDRNCVIASQITANFVNVLQDDGLNAIYLHLRNGSVTTLPVGARVAAGDYLGTVGSSGQSSGPHLHFELRDAAGNVVDPRHGQCNAVADRWIVFQAYEDPRIDSLSTHSAEPVFLPCGVDDAGNPIDETPNYKNTFAPGDVFWVFASYSDLRSGENTDFRILRPDMSEFAHWGFDLASQHLPSAFYSGTALDWKYTLPADAPSGIWTIVAEFSGKTYTRTFVVQTPITLGGYMSGNWFDPRPNQSGHGFQLEFTNQANAAVAIWFVYAPDGGAQNWIYAQGSYDATKDTVTLPAVILSGGKFPPNFKSSDVTQTQWGTLTLAFTDCDHGTASWNSTLPGYGNGALPIARLTQIEGTHCPQ